VAEEAGPHQIDAPAGWTDLTYLGDRLASNAAVASWGGEEIQVFAIRDDAVVANRYWDGTRWHEWESLGGPFTGQPAAAARDADRIDVLAIGADGVLRHRWWDGTSWVPWQPVPGAPSAARGVSAAWSGSGGHLDVCVVDAAGAAAHLRLRP